MLSIREFPARAWHCSRPARALPAVLALALGLAACADEPTRPTTGGPEQEEGGRTLPRTLGLVEITISGLGTGQVTSSALSAPTVEALERLRAEREAGGAEAAGPGSLAPQDFTLPADSTGGRDGTIQLELLSTGSFTDGVRGSGGVRYLWATYRVRNAPAGDSTGYNTERRNLTFYAVDTDSTLGVTAISSLERFDGSPADSALAAQLIPTGGVSKNPRSAAIESAGPDVLQVVTETEADAIQALADTAGVADVFPYGFVVRNPSDPTSRMLPLSPAPGQFDGIVTFAFKVPLQATASEDPFTVSAIFLAVDDDGVKITQAVEEQTPAGRAAFDARADALGAEVLTLLPAGGGTVWTDRAVRVLCEVRVAGPAGSPTATLSPTPGTEPWLVVPPLRRESYTLPGTVRLAVAGCPSIAPEDTASFLVHGFQSVPGIGAGYQGMGMSLVRAPARPGGKFFPGEEVEVTLKSDLTGTTPVVARYRVAVTSGSGTFAAGAAYAVGTSPLSVALGDLDRDGDLDLVAANFDSNNVSVLFVGGGSSPDTTYGVGAFPGSIALGDVDGDGALDLAVANTGSDNVSVLLNQGNGSFGPDAAYGVGSGPWSVALGDVDGDSDLDLVAANAASDSVSVLLNDGYGSFGSPAVYGVGALPYSVALGDVDGDGTLDLAVANGNFNNVSVLLNQGGGTFGPQATYGVGMYPRSIALGDLDGDGALDLAVANQVSSNISVLLNQGDGTFGSQAAYGVGSLPTSVALGDVDGDGDLDLATANQNSNTVSVLLNQGDGTFGPQVTYAVGDGPQSVALGDLDGDGDLDLVTANFSSNNVSVLLNR